MHVVEGAGPVSDSYGVLIISKDVPVWVLVPGAGAGAGCCELAVRVVETGCRCRLLVWWAVVLVQGAVSARVGDWAPVLGAGCARGGDRVPGAGCRCWVLCGRRELACRCLVLVPASDSEVITAAASDSEG